MIGGTKTGRRIRNALAPGGLILMYHRIADADLDPWSLCVSPSLFASQMEAVKEVASPLPLRDLVARAQQRTLPRRAVAITFDDGYEDNATEAAPVLERLEIPATVFVTSAAVGSGIPFWWDELQRILLGPTQLPNHLRLHVRDRTLEWELGADAQMSPAALHRHVGWKASHAPVSQRHRVYQELGRELRQLTAAERSRGLEQFREWAGTDPADAPGRPMSAAALARLAEAPGMEIGAHGQTHARLSALSPAEQVEEIGGSKTALEKMIGRAVGAFAYPFGGKADYTDETMRIVRETGYTMACISSPGAIRAETNRFELPRMQPTNWTGRELAARVLWWARSQQ